MEYAYAFPFPTCLNSAHLLGRTEPYFRLTRAVGIAVGVIRTILGPIELGPVAGLVMTPRDDYSSSRSLYVRD